MKPSLLVQNVWDFCRTLCDNRVGHGPLVPNKERVTARTKVVLRGRTRQLAAALPLLLVGCLHATAAQGAVPPPATATPQAASASVTQPSNTTAPATAARLPIESFASLPQLSMVALSPDGQRIAAVVNRQDQSLLITRAVDGSTQKAITQTDNLKFRFRWVRWVNNERLLFGITFADLRQSVPTVETRLMSVKADGTGLVNLVQNKPDTRSALREGAGQQFQDQVVDWLPEDGQHVLLQLAQADGDATPAVYRVNVETGLRRSVHPASRDVYQWITDAHHRVRVGVRSTNEGEFEIRACDPDGSRWRSLWTFTAKGEAVWPLGFGLDPQELFVEAEHEGRRAIFSVRLDDPALPRRLRLSDPRYDVGGSLLHSPATGEVVGLRSSRSDTAEGDSRNEIWEPGWRSLQRGIDKALPDDDAWLMSMTRDEKRYLVFASGNGRPGRYFVGDRNTGELTMLGETYPGLPHEQLAQKQPIQIEARDKLSLSAYLTLPVGRHLDDSGSPLPMVLLPHGGPGSRDDADFDPWTALLADRGYAVLQVNFRGSDGYGRAFKVAGFQRWGLEMQDDLSDAVQWAITRRVVDAGRVCIVGGSYGGYAALMGAVKTPGLYRCAVSFAGVTDLPELVSHQGEYVGGKAAADLTIGDAWRDRERLRATSPALQAAAIQAPVLLVHGSDDRSVPVAQSRDMAQALKAAGKTYRYIEQPGGDHHLSRYSHRLEFFKALETFLEQNLRPAAR